MGNGLISCDVTGCSEHLWLSDDTLNPITPGTPPLAAEYPESYHDRDSLDPADIPPGIQKAFSVMGFLIVSLFVMLILCFLVVGIVKCLELIL